MSHRPLPTQAVHRDYMEKFNGSFRNRFWFVISVSFFLWFLMFYLHSRALSGPRNNIQSIPKEYANLVLRDMETQKPNHQLPEPNEVNTQPHVDHQLPVSQEMNKHLPVNPLPASRNIDTPPSIDQLPVSQEVDTQLRLNQLPELSDVDTPSERVDPLTVLVELETQTPFNQLPVSQDVDTQPHVDHRLPVSQEVDAQLPINQSPIIQKRPMQNKDPCSGHYVYVHKLPSRFNEDMLKECKKLSLWTDMCRFTSNAGLGPTLDRSEHVFSTRGWFATNQFALDVIFNNRMKQYKCLTNDSTKASAVFVPFYAGLDISRYLWGSNTSVRDSASLDIIKWLTAQPEWRAMWGRDHFLVAGRITWDFRRTTDKESDWGNKLIILPEAKNMTILVIESSPWSSNDFGIPYPTYFHPSNDHQIIQWQNRMRRIKRRWLFSFAGGPRKNISGLIRGAIVDQCRASSRGKLLECNTGPSKCHSPSSLMKMFQSSVFCLQTQGDSFTRRSTFDSMLAGCIPVFFHPGSAYVQYVWHLPRNYKKYSVFIPAGDVSEGKASIEKILLEIPASKVRAMRKNVIEMIPRLIYADPRSRLERFEDAFDVAVKGVIEKVNRSRKEMRDGIRNVGFDEKKNWKYDLIGRDGPHEWDPFFSKPKDSDTKKRK